MQLNLYKTYCKSVLLFCLLLAQQQLLAQCPCTNCPQNIADLATTSINANVSGSTNAILGQNGQALCGVNLKFTHQYLSDVQISLTAPNGSSVSLAGPIDLSAPTDGTTWDISFVPCSQTAAPDFPSIFSPNFTTTQPWGSGGNYNGSYHPYIGCLEGFNGSNVNGNWTLNIVDGDLFDVGVLIDFELIFCDISGIDCITCDAAAGNITNPDLISCVGAANLNLGLVPAYPTGVTPPPSSLYNYRYVLSNGGVIINYLTASDLRSLPAGMYGLCGLSYLKSQNNLLPAPNTGVTMAQLRAQLNGATPPFCGDLSNNCMNITINPSVPASYDTIQMCQGQCQIIQGLLVCDAGDYAIPAMQNSCNYIANYHVKITPAPVTALQETICKGSCSSYSFVPAPCPPGVYRDTIKTAAGCDSILSLTLTVIDVASAIVQPIDTLSCARQTILLDGRQSSSGAGVTYAWTTSNGSINTNASLDSLRVSTAGTYTLRVCKTLNGVQCCKDSSIVVRGTKIVPPAPKNLTGNLAVCANSSSTYTFTGSSLATSYVWTASGAANITSGQGNTTATINFGTLSSQVCVRSQNGCGFSVDSCINVAVLTIPIRPSFSGLDTVCQNQSSVYTVSSPSANAYYRWQISNGTASYNVDSSICTVTWSANPGQICLKAYNFCGQSLDTCKTVFVRSTPPKPILTGPISSCTGDTVRYAITNGSSKFTYTWMISGNMAIIGQNDTAFVDLVWNSGTSDSVCVLASNTCGQSLKSCVRTSISIKPQANAGIDLSLCGRATTFAATPASIGQGNWSQSSGPSAAVINQVQNPSSAVSVTAFGTYNFVWSVQNNGCIDEDTVRLVFNENPSIGAATVTCNPANDSFKISFPILGGTSPYTIGSQSITTSTFSSTSIASGQGYSFFVSDSEGCKSTILSGSHTCACLTDAGTMSLIALESCVGDSVRAIFNQDSILDINDAFQYIMHSNNGVSLGTIFGQNQTGIFQFQAGMMAGQTYYISAVAGNANTNGTVNQSDLCLSVSQGQPVIFHALPSVNAGLDRDTCALSLNLNASPTNGAWTLINKPTASTGIFASSTNATSAFTGDSSGIYQLEWTTTANNCIAKDTVAVILHPPPSISNLIIACLPSNDSFQVSFTISSGRPPYRVNGQAIAGQQFTSAPIFSGSNYSFLIRDDLQCSAPTLSGQFNCTCTTAAGTMSTSLLELCARDTAKAVFNMDAILEANDSLAFVLHESSSTTLGTIFATNKTGHFTFQTGMVFGQRYYISALAGNADTNGNIDQNDPCLSVSLGQPVIFHAFPAVNAGLDRDTCALTLNLNASPSSGFWDILNQPSGSTGFFSAAASNTSKFTADTAGMYQLEWTTTSNNCSSKDTVVLNLHTVPTITNLLANCLPSNDSFQVTFTISGGMPPFTVNGQAVSGTAFTSTTFVSGASYSFQVEDIFQCSSPTRTGQYNCLCTTNAGSLATITLRLCESDTAKAAFNNDAVLDANDTLMFVLHDGNNTNLGTILSSNKTGQFTFLAGMVLGQTYYIAALAGNANSDGTVNQTDPCLSVSQGQAVIFNAFPSVNAGFNRDTCGNQIFLNAQNSAGVWSVFSKPINSNPLFTNPNNPNAVFQSDSSGLYYLIWTVTSANTCVAKDSVEINLFGSPNSINLTKICDSTNTDFILDFYIQNGTAPYTVSGIAGTLTGKHFVSAAMPSGSMYQFTIEDANACRSQQISGTGTCDCGTFAGTMSSAAIQDFCANSMATALWNNDAQLNLDDSLAYVLHSSNTASLGTLYGISSSPNFDFADSLNLDQIYYISAIAGQIINGTINLQDPCLSVAIATPVRWRALPTVQLPADSLLCLGDSLQLLVTGTGFFPLQVQLQDNNGQGYSLPINSSAGVVFSAFPNQNTQYRLLSVQETTGAQCLNDTSAATFNLQVLTRPEAEIDSNFTVCNNSAFGSTLNFSTLILNGDQSGIWENLDGIGSGTLPNLDFDGSPPGLYTFMYNIGSTQNPCSAQYPVKIMVENCMCPPVNIPPLGAFCTSTASIDLSVYQPNQQNGIWAIENAPNGSNPASLQNAILTTNQADAGTYSLLFILSPAPMNGCPDTVRSSLILRAALSAGTALLPLSFCENADTLLDLNQQIQGAASSGTWTQSVLNTSVPGSFLPTGSFQTQQNPYGNYTFAYSVTNQSPCAADTSVVEVIILESPIADAGADQELNCQDSTVVLGSTASSQGTAISYFWKKNGQILLNSDSLFYSTQSVGVYTLSVKNGQNTCTAQDSVLVSLDTSFPSIDSLFVGQPTCFQPENGSIVLRQLSGGQAPYSIFLNGVSYGIQTDFSNLPIGNYSLIVQDAVGCTLDFPNTITINNYKALTIAFPNAEEVVHLGDSVRLEAILEPPNTSLVEVQWSMLLDSSAANSLSQTFAPLHSFRLVLTVKDSLGCTSQATVLVRVENERKVFFPTIFTPTQSTNAIYMLYTGNDVERIEQFQIYNRWGALVFENNAVELNSIVSGWNGKQKGKDAPGGVYVVKALIRFKDGTTEWFVKDLTLLR